MKILCIFISILLLLTACGKSGQDGTSTRQWIYQNPQNKGETVPCSFEELLGCCTHAAEAVFVAYHEQEAYTQLEFSVKEDLLGNLDEKTVYVYEPVVTTTVTDGQEPCLISANYSYQVGEEYLLLLEKRQSVYYARDRYMLVGDIVIPLAHPEESLQDGEPLILHMETDIQPEELPGYVKRCLSQLSVQEKEKAYIDSSDISEIAGFAEYALVVKVDALQRKWNDADAETYSCTVKKVLSGSEDIQASIYLSFFTNQVETGRQYLVMAQRAGEKSMVFTLASRENSVIGLDNDKAVAEVLDVLGINADAIQ